MELRIYACFHNRIYYLGKCIGSLGGLAEPDAST